MEPLTCLTLSRNSRIASKSLESARHFAADGLSVRPGPLGWLTPLAVVLFLLPLGNLSAQQTQYPQQDWPPDQTPDQQSGYNQQQPYTQQPYAPQGPYAGQGYSQQGYAPARPLSAQQL